MSKCLIQTLIIIAGVCVLSACGNKGELFLPDGTALTDVLQPVDAVTGDSTTEIDDDEVFEKKKRADDKP